MKESDIQKDILNYCAAVGIFARRRNSAGRQKMKGYWINLGEKGAADIWGILKGGRHFECEVKIPGKKPTDEQLQWLRDCANFGALAFWTDSLEEFVGTINNHFKGTK